MFYRNWKLCDLFLVIIFLPQKMKGKISLSFILVLRCFARRRKRKMEKPKEISAKSWFGIFNRNFWRCERLYVRLLYAE